MQSKLQIKDEYFEMLIMIGTFPPPVHGMAAVNQALHERLVSEGIAVEKLDIAPNTLKRDIFSRLSRIRKILIAWFHLLCAQGKENVLYLSLSGGWGQIYDIITVAAARLRKMYCVIHHHNYSYFQKRRSLTYFLFKLAGRETTHVVLCYEMGHLLHFHYGPDTNFTVLSNLVFSPVDLLYRHRMNLRTVGFLSNVTREKGGETIIELAYVIHEAKLPLQVIIAGPCHDEILTQKLRKAVLDNVLEWRGAVYGEEKVKFWREIDAFIFPTKYEAEPLVIWEALNASLPVITFCRGCIPEQVETAGVLVQPHADFVSNALATLEQWYQDETKYQDFTHRSSTQYHAALEKTRSQWQSLLTILVRQDYG